MIGCEIDWPDRADHVIRRCFPHLRGPDREDAHAEAMASGWAAWQNGALDGDCGGYLFRAMRNGVVDWIRRELGRKGQKLVMHMAVSLEAPIPGSYAVLGDLLLDTETDRARRRIEDEDQVARLVSRTPLSKAERRWVDCSLTGQSSAEISRAAGVTEAAICHARKSALERLRTTAGSAEVV